MSTSGPPPASSDWVNQLPASGSRSGAATTPWRSTVRPSRPASISPLSRWMSPRRRWLKRRPGRARRARAAATIASASADVRAIGFSDSTCSPRSSAAIAIGACRNVGTATLTASSSSSSRSSQRATACSTPYSPASSVADVLLEPGDRRDRHAVERVVRVDVLLPGPAQADHADATRITRTTHAAIRAAGRRRPQPRRRPLDRVGEHAPDVRVVVDGVVLVAGAEVEDPARAALEAAAAAEHLAAGEGADEHQLVGRRDRERLAVHLLRVDHDRLRDARRDRVRRGDGPHQFALALVAPAQVAGGAEQAAEDLRVVPGVQDEQPHAAEHRLLHAFDDRVVDLACAMCPHQVSTSVSSSTSGVSPCSGSSSVAVRTCTRSPSSSASPEAIAPCRPSG